MFGRVQNKRCSGEQARAAVRGEGGRHAQDLRGPHEPDTAEQGTHLLLHAILLIYETMKAFLQIIFRSGEDAGPAQQDERSAAPQVSTIIWFLESIDYLKVNIRSQKSAGAEAEGDRRLPRQVLAHARGGGCAAGQPDGYGSYGSRTGITVSLDHGEILVCRRDRVLGVLPGARASTPDLRGEQTAAAHVREPHGSVR